MIAKVAVTSVAFWVDRPYDYLVSPELTDKIRVGMRALVPFGRGNRQTEAFVLALSEGNAQDRPLKPLETLLDEEPLLSPELLKLALWMRERFFCTVGDAVRAMLPAGIWVHANGKRQTTDKHEKWVSLLISGEEAAAIAAQKKRAAPQQSAVLALLSTLGAASAADIKGFTGATLATLKALQNAELVALEEREVFRRPQIFDGERRPLPTLTEAQERVSLGLKALLREEKSAAALLWGVTGSGKTSVYMHLIQETLSAGKDALLLVPEIALTPQMIAAFSAVFGDIVAVMHSSLSVGERYDEWKRIRTGKAQLVIGTRSAVFAPTANLGLIILDEEQEQTYKSEEKPRYHAREVAKYRCARANALLLLGSATPSVETRYYAEQGRYAYFALPERFNRHALPEVQIVDMKKELREGFGGSMSRALLGEIESNLAADQQSILFLNRRGYGKLLSCCDCGYTFTCPRCSVSLTYHSTNHRLLCHYCGYSEPVRHTCPDCGGKLLLHGEGTQKIEEELREHFPEAEVLRMDTDTVTAAGSHAALLDRFRKEKIPLMIGTQMVTKGLDFEGVTLVGVLSADQSLYIGDYRAGERSFSLITQVVGRSGRGETPGRAVIQTFTPENQVIRLAAAQDYESFYRAEIELRRLQKAPPFTDLFVLTASGVHEAEVLKCCRALRDELENRLKHRKDVEVLGPAPLFVVRVNNRFRYRITLFCKADKEIRTLIAYLIGKFSTDKEFGRVAVYADSDPAD